MNIDAESIALLSLILRDAPQDRQFILCILARSNQVPSPIKFHSNTDYPTFYGYSNERVPFYIMGKKIISNIPRQGSAKRLISAEHLSYAETVINSGNWELSNLTHFVSKLITLDNKTAYNEVGVYLVFRDKAKDFIKEYISYNNQLSGFLKSKLGRFEYGSKLLSEKTTKEPDTDLNKQYEQLLEEINPKQNKEVTSNDSNQPTIADAKVTSQWSDNFKWSGKDFIFGTYGKIHFNSKTVMNLFSELTNAKGKWVNVKKLREVTGKDDNYVRPTIGQIEKRMDKELKKYISIPSTEEDTLEPMPSEGAYRIKFAPKSQ